MIFSHECLEIWKECSAYITDNLACTPNPGVRRVHDRYRRRQYIFPVKVHIRKLALWRETVNYNVITHIFYPRVNNKTGIKDWLNATVWNVKHASRLITSGGLWNQPTCSRLWQHGLAVSAGSARRRRHKQKFKYLKSKAANSEWPGWAGFT